MFGQFSQFLRFGHSTALLSHLTGHGLDLLGAQCRAETL